MAMIRLTGSQIDEVVKNELLFRMIDYAYSYDDPDVDEVLNFYAVWRFYANDTDFRLLKEVHPTIHEIVSSGW